MHSGDGGVLLYLHGSVLKDLLGPGEPFGHGTATVGRDKLWEELQAAYGDVGEQKRLSTLTLEMIGG